MIYSVTIPQFKKMLQNLKLFLKKASIHAETKKFDIDILLNSRLAPDQFNFIRQVQIACDSAKMAAAKLSGKEAPVHEDNEKNLTDIINRIDKVINYLDGFKEADFLEAKSRKISHPRWEGKYLMGEEYVAQYNLPNFYFHITTAYSILRHNGVDLGKKDYLGELPYKA